MPIVNFTQQEVEELEQLEQDYILLEEERDQLQAENRLLKQRKEKLESILRNINHNAATITEESQHYGWWKCEQIAEHTKEWA